MNYLNERVAYLKGLADGMQINDSTNEGKLLKSIIEVLDDFAISITDIREVQDEISELVDDIDQDLSDVENIVFEMDEDEDEYLGLLECPYCNEEFEFDEDLLDEEGKTIECPNCHKEIETEWECECDKCGDHDHN